MLKYVALAALLTAAPSIPQEAFDRSAYPHDEAAIQLIYCQRVDGAASGTAFKVGPTYYLTARHVVLGGQCSIGGVPVTINTMDEKHDFATLTGPASPHILATNCRGFHSGQTYLARGFPGGQSYNIFMPMIASALSVGGFRTFTGADVIPGMSGGPVMDTQGRVTGIVNMRWPSRSMPLSSTGFCRG